MENSEQPAFTLHPETGVGDPETSRLGLTKREYFAAMAMQGLIPRVNQYQPGDRISMLTSDAVAFADELLKQLEL
jgi:hypothetical protein